MMSFHSGFIAIVGPPNVGKSTLLNTILGEKLSIVTPKPQTTRNRIMGVLHGEDFQMVFVDTPGIHKTHTPLHRSMVQSARAALHEVDIILTLVEMGRPDDPEIPPLIRSIREFKKPRLLAVNKIDKGAKERLLPIMEDIQPPQRLRCHRARVGPAWRRRPCAPCRIAAASETRARVFPARGENGSVRILSGFGDHP